MEITELVIDKKNDRFNFNDNGKTIKKVKEGIIINIILFDKSITFPGSFVSQYSQTKAKKEVRGIEAKIPAKSDDRFAISETITTIKAVNINLIIR